LKIPIKYIFFLFLLGIASKTFSQQTIKGKIVRVSDGDTITLLNENNRQIRIRLYGIDCPDYGQKYYGTIFIEAEASIIGTLNLIG
jgi:endonuclease YncB( thermonuclease family)